ncbi:hypothetical protein [Mycobacterium sp. URHB0021]
MDAAGGRFVDEAKRGDLEVMAEVVTVAVQKALMLARPLAFLRKDCSVRG